MRLVQRRAYWSAKETKSAYRRKIFEREEHGRMEYQNIFMPCKLKTGDVLKNRMIYPNAQQTMVVGPETWPTEQMIEDVADLASSGVSLMCFGQFDTHGGGTDPLKHTAKKTHFPGFDYSDPGTWNYLAQTARTAHLFGTKLLIKLSPGFPDGSNYGGGDAGSMFPRPVNEPKLHLPKRGFENFFRNAHLTEEQMVARIATKEQIQTAIQELVDLCVMYKKNGWDGLSFRADRFIDAATNLRTDEYGGEIENRGRFQLELYTAIKAACGDDFIIEISLMGDSEHGHDAQLPHGYTEEEFIRFVKLVEPVVDIVEIRERNGVGYQCNSWNTKLHDHLTLSYAKHLREAGFQGIIAVNGGYNDPDEMERILGEGVVDLISCARSFKVEPRFMDKLRSGGREVPVPCLFCNKCHGSTQDPPVHYCSLNPKNVMTHRLPVIEKPSFGPKKLAVIGGGPIGMRAACFAAEKGHQVTLFEKSDFLGGKMRYAALYPDTWPHERYRQWLIGELDRRGVEVRLSCEPDPQELTQAGFNALFACTGSVEKRPPIEGADSEGVWLDQDVYEGRAQIGQKVVVVGGGSVATETAMYLASLGKDVTILTRQDVLMPKDARVHGPHTAFEIIVDGLGYGGVGPAWTAYDNLKPVYGVTTTKITPRSVTYVEKGREVTIPCDSVVVSGGYSPCTDEALRYAACTPNFYILGDADPRSSNLAEGNYNAYGRACLL